MAGINGSSLSEASASLESPAGARAPELTANDGQYFSSHDCYWGGEFHMCLPNWYNGGWAEWQAKSSFLEIAPFSGGTVYVQMQKGGSYAYGFLDPAFQGGVYSFYAYSSWINYGCSWGVACGGNYDYETQDHRWDLVNASGKGFHWTFEARTNCTYIACNQPI